MNAGARLRLACVLGILGTLGACSRDSKVSPATTLPAQDLPEGIVARIGALNVSARTVERIASASRIAPEIALERASGDALFASHARDSLPSATLVVVERAALGRSLLEGLVVEARHRGPPSDAEIERVTRERWVELDRPPGARVTHAVALFPKSGDREAPRRVAEAILRAVSGIRDPEAFSTAAKSVPAGQTAVRLENLPAMTPSGRAFSLEGPLRGSQYFDATFAQAANALAEPGDQSGIVETAFGFHVLLLEAKYPEVRVPLDDRRRLLEPDVLSHRAGELRKKLIESLSARERVEVARDFDARTAGLGGS